MADYLPGYAGPPVVWAWLIFYLSSVPGLKTPLEWDYALRKTAHAFEYAVLCVLLARAGAGARLSVRRRAACALCLAVLYAVTDEYHQSFVPGRFCSSADVAVDAAGALAGLYLYIRHRSGVAKWKK
ncbi:MAG: VanZ family protein [Elusimicrobiaceae bacterium]|nr:VanZ family protein [Elusimicrobiaceae bacterium]